MASRTIEIKANFVAALQGMDGVVSQMKQGLAKIDAQSSKSTHFSKLFEQYGEEYKKLQGLIASGAIDPLDSKEVIKSGEKITKIFRQVSTEYGDLSKMDVDLAKKLFPQEFTDAASKAEKAIKSFEQSSKTLDNAQQEFDRAFDELDRLDKAVKSAEQALKSINYSPEKMEEADKKLAELTRKHERLELQLKSTFGVDSVSALETEIKQNETELRELEKTLKRVSAAKKEFERSGKTKGSTKAELEAAQRYAALSAKEKREASMEGSKNYDLHKAFADSGARDARKWVEQTKREMEAWGEIEDLPTMETQRAELEKRSNAANAYKDSTKAVKEQQAAVDALDKKTTSYFNAVKQYDAAKSKYEEQERQVQELEESIQNLKNNEGDIKKLFKTLDKLGANPEGLEATTENLEEIKQTLGNMDESTKNKIVENIRNMGISAEQAERLVEGLREELGGIGQTAKEISDAEREMENLKERVKQFFAISNSIQLFKRAISDAFNTVKELDAVMTETAVVTEFSVSDMWGKLPEYAQSASTLGTSIKDLYGATTLYYQQGLRTNAAMGVGVETMKMARIANMEASDATQAMTAALRGFNMEVNEMNAQHVNDVYSELAAITAADTSQIATAMSKTASIAASANMEFETTAALLSQIIETTQEAPETAGTAMKTIIARFTEVKELFSEGMLTGEDEEGEEININKIDTALSSVGISLKDFLTGSKGIDDIFLELASKWDGLDLATQRYIATMAAGSRQQSRFIAMMSNYDRTMELVNAAQNSAGASQEQFNKTLDSVEAKLQQLRNAWDQFVMGLANDQILKAAITFLTKIFEVINWILDKISGGNGLTKSVLTLVTAFGALRGIGAIIKKVFASDILKTAVDAFSEVSRQAGTTGTESGQNLRRNFKAELEQMGSDAYAAGQQVRQNFDAGVNGSGPVKIPTQAPADKAGDEKPNQTPKNTGAEKKATAGQFRMAGMATVAAGSLLNYAGAAAKAEDETSILGTALEGMGTTATVAGSAISILAPVLVKLGASLGAVAGYAAIAIVAIGLIVTVFQAIKANSPEGKLQAAQKAAQKAGEAADKAAESFANLNESLGQLEEKQATLDGLIKGTQDWRDAVIEVNNQILDLIARFPALAAFVESEDGVLSFNQEKTDAQGRTYEQAYKQYEDAISNANITKTMADIEVQRRQQSVSFDNLSDEAKQDREVYVDEEGRTFYNAEQYASFQNSERAVNYNEALKRWETLLKEPRSDEDSTKELALSIVSGEITQEESELSEEVYNELAAFGGEIYASEAAIDVFTNSLVNAATIIAGLTPEQTDSLEGAYTPEIIEQRTNNRQQDYLDTLAGLKDAEDGRSGEQLKQEYANAMNYKYDGDKFYSIDEKGAWQEEAVTDNKIATNLAGIDVKNEMAEDMKAMAPIVDAYSKAASGTAEKAIANVLGGAEGSDLSFNDLEQLDQLLSQATIDPETGKITNFGLGELANIYSKFDDIYPTMQEFYDLLMGHYKEGKIRYDQAISDTEERREAERKVGSDGKVAYIPDSGGIIQKHLGLDFGNLQTVSNTALSGMTSNMRKVADGIGAESFNDISESINAIFEGLEPADAELFAEALADMNWDDARDVEGLGERLEDLDFGGDLSSIDDLESKIIELLRLVPSVSDMTAETIASLAAAAKKLRDGGALSEDEYNVLTEQNPDIAGSFIKVGDEYYLSGGNSREIAGQIEAQIQESVVDLGESVQRGADIEKILSVEKNEDRAAQLASGQETGHSAESDILFARRVLETSGIGLEETKGWNDDYILSRFKTMYENNYGIGGEVYKTNAENYQQSVVARGTLDGLPDNDVTAAAVDPSLANLATSLDMDPAGLIEYKNHLREINTELTEYQAGVLAEDFAKTSAAAIALSDNWDDWTAALREGEAAITKGKRASVDYYSALNNMKKQTAQLLGTQEELSDSFIKTAKDSGLLKKAIEGNEDALGELRKMAANDIGIEVGLEGDSLQNVNDIVSDFIDSAEYDDLEIGANLTTTALGEQLNQLLNDGKITVDQMNSILEGIGWEPEITYAEMPLSEVQSFTGNQEQEIMVPVYENGQIVDYKKTTVSAAQSGGIQGNQMVRVPILGSQVSKAKTSGYNVGVEASYKGSNISRPSSRSSGGGGGGGGGGSENKWENPYDELYNSVEDINEELRTREKLERRYQRLLDVTKTKAADLVKNAELQLASLEKERAMRIELLAGRERQMAEAEREYSDLSQYAWYNELDKTVEINWNLINSLDGSTNEELTSRIEEYIGKLEERQDQIEEEEDALAEIEDAVKEIRDQGKEEYFELEGQIRDAIEQARQEEIDKLSAINDSINDTNSRMMEALQQSIDQYRQDRDNERTEEELSDKQRRLAYLQQDTSGANALEILQLQKEIEEGQESYTDTLIDQKISELQEQNDLAAEQREQQIQILEEQLRYYLENGYVWQDVYALMEEGIDVNGIKFDSDLADILQYGANFEAMSELEKMKWMEETEDLIAQAVQWLKIGNRAINLINEGMLSPGQRISFTDLTGKVIEGVLESNGFIRGDDGHTYSGIHRNADGTYSSFESHAFGRTMTSTENFDLSWLFNRKIKKYKTGGLADFTGPAWLDGTKSKPEYILNSNQTKAFFSLVNVLEGFKSGNSTNTDKSVGDSIYDIEINVDSIGSDYDVDQLATRIKELINEDARYRNNNAVSLTR